MYEWNEAVQQMIDWLDAHITETPTLLEMSKQIGYSPYYCSSRFHAITGVTLKNYMAARRLSLAAEALRDTDARILDIALNYGFSSQQALTRAFVYAYGCTPAAYRRNPGPIPVSMKKEVLFPEYYEQGDRNMEKTILTEAKVRVEYIPAHKYIAVRDAQVQAYFPFFERHNCDEICGVIESMTHVMHPVVTCHTGGWFFDQGRRGYTYGLGVPDDYTGPVPEGFEVREYPGSYYLAFYHPAFDFLQDCEKVLTRVEDLAWNFDPSAMGFAWNETECQDYQRMLPETIGYEVLRPVRKG